MFDKIKHFIYKLIKQNMEYVLTKFNILCKFAKQIKECFFFTRIKKNIYFSKEFTSDLID